MTWNPSQGWFTRAWGKLSKNRCMSMDAQEEQGSRRRQRLPILDCKIIVGQYEITALTMSNNNVKFWSQNRYVQWGDEPRQVFKSLQDEYRIYKKPADITSREFVTFCREFEEHLDVKQRNEGSEEDIQHRRHLLQKRIIARLLGEWWCKDKIDRNLTKKTMQRKQTPNFGRWM